MNLQGRWENFIARVGGVADRTFQDVLEPRYNEPHRYYHTLRHIESCLQYLDTYGDTLRSQESRDPIEMAIWFHDVSYDPLVGSNEIRSAEVFFQCSEPDVLSDDVDEFSMRHVVYDMILATSDHLSHTASEAMDLFLDIDLAVLGAPGPAYLKYAADVRKEYDFVPHGTYATKRNEVLSDLLNRPWIYRTEVFRHYHEGRARENMCLEIQALRASVSSA